jgi:serine/threonine-protein kinase
MRPRIEDYLRWVSEPDRAQLFDELLKLELELRRKAGERPEAGEYHRRFPEYTQRIKDAFDSARPAAARPGSEMDHNLFFGLLALQNNFINRAQLVAAFAAWLPDKTRPFAQLLVDCGALDEMRRSLLEALAGEHFKQQGDPVASLSALSAVSSIRDDLSRIADPDLNAWLTGLAIAPSGDEATVTYTSGGLGRAEERYRVLRPHAKGGLGAVFVAIDGELNREVALKEILDRHANDPASRQRFLMEAEITGGLEHPGIVPVYGRGFHANGRPYYAMRFIKGDSLKDAIAAFHAGAARKRDPGARALELQKLLRSLLNVCNAIEYAHSRGILHRDIKPANVIVGKYGETLLVDWGLAKASGRREPGSEVGEKTLKPTSSGGSAETLPGAVVGTPSYMSPEQAEGRIDELGLRTDVYSLGATLYSVLTGRPPFAGDEVPVLLGRVSQGDFPSPRAIDRTIDRALEAICLKAMALKPQDRYASARAMADEIERWIAGEAVAAYREGIPSKVARWARRHRSAARIAASAFAAITVTTLGAALLIESARRREREALEIAGDALYAAGRSQVVTGKSAEARESFEKAVKIVERLVEASPAVLKFRSALAIDRNNIGILLSNEGKYTESMESLQGALKIQKDLVRAVPESAECKDDLARTYLNIAVLLSREAKPTEAIASYTEALGIYKDLHQTHRGDIKFERELGICHYDIGALLFSQDLTRALASFEAALSVQREIMSTNPDSSQFKCDLARTLNSIGLIQYKMANRAEALASFETASTTLEPLITAEPTVLEFKSVLAKVFNNIGSFYAEDAKLAQALSSYERARSSQEALVNASPGDVEFKNDLALSCANIYTIQRALGHTTEAVASLERGLAIREQLADQFPNDPERQAEAANTAIELATRRPWLSDPAANLRLARKALSRLAGIAKPTPDILYAMARGRAQVGFFAEKVPAELRESSSSHFDAAMRLLQQAVAAGCCELAMISTDSAFEPLRSRPDFQLLLMDLAFPADPIRVAR